MEFVDVRGRKKKRNLLRRRQQHVGRRNALALAARCRGVAGARLDRNVEPHIPDRRADIARDIDCKRLQRRDVERVQAAPAAFLQVDEARQKSGESLAAARRRDQQM
jgi:hypothetical protein